MKCDKAQEFFSDYIENTLDRPMTVALETHLSGCEACSADVADLRSMWTVLDKVPQVEPPADFVWRTTTRLQNELLNRREAERARPLPWWKRLTPVQSFSYAGIAAMLVVGLAIGAHSIIPAQTWGIGWPFGGHKEALPPPPAVVVTAPTFDVQMPGADGSAATVTLRATSAVPSASITVAFLTPYNGTLVGRPQVVGRQALWAAGQAWPVSIPNGGARAAEITVLSATNGGVKVVAQKRLILPPAAGTEPVASLQSADPYFALQQIAGRTGHPILVDSGLATPVTVDLTSGMPQQALDQAVHQLGVHPDSTQSGVLSLTR